jgi:predicted dehydrogenase
MHGHIPGFKRHSDAQVVAVCDTNSERANALATSHGIPTVYTNWREIIADPTIDAVTIALPNALHAEVSIAALNAGKHVLCEKPLAMTVAQGEEMVATAHRQGRVLAINMSNRPRGEVQYMRAKVAEGRIGTISYASGRMIRRAASPALAAGLPAKNCRVAAPCSISACTCSTWCSTSLATQRSVPYGAKCKRSHGPQRRGIGGWGSDRVMDGTFDVDDLASLHLRLADGGLVTIEVTWAFYGQNEERIQVVGNQGGFDFFPTLYGSDKPLRFYSDDNGSPIETIPTLPRSAPSRRTTLSIAALSIRFVAPVV